MRKTKRSLTFNDEVWDMMQQEAERLGVSVSALISITMSTSIKGQQALNQMDKVRELLERHQESASEEEN